MTIDSFLLLFSISGTIGFYGGCATLVNYCYYDKLVLDARQSNSVLIKTVRIAVKQMNRSSSLYFGPVIREVARRFVF